jgi:hypothetical protein
MAYRIIHEGVTIECDTADELKAVVSLGKRNGSPTKARRKRRSSVSSSWIKKSWRAARALAKREGITVTEARSKLAKKK